MFALTIVLFAVSAPAGAISSISSSASGSRLADEPGEKVQEAVSLTGEKNKESWIFFNGFFDLGIASLKQDRASQMRTSDSGFSFGLGIGATFIKYFNLAVGGQLVSLKDEDPFWQLTTGGERKSSVGVATYYAQAGLQLPVPVRDKRGLFLFWIGCDLGIMGTGASRDISSCVDCNVERFAFSGGAYLKPALKIQISRKVWVAVSYTFFSSKADFRNMMALTVSGHFSPKDESFD